MRDDRRLDDTFLDSFAAPQRFAGGIVHVVLDDAEYRGEALRT